MARKKKDNVTYTLTDSPLKEGVDIDKLIEKLESVEYEPDNAMVEYDTSTHNANESVGTDYYLAQVQEYDLNYTTKQLICINDYYQLGNASKLKKMELTERIVWFESNDANTEIVARRQTLWFYLQELKNDPFTKKFVWAA